MSRQVPRLRFCFLQREVPVEDFSLSLTPRPPFSLSLRPPSYDALALLRSFFRMYAGCCCCCCIGCLRFPAAPQRRMHLDRLAPTSPSSRYNRRSPFVGCARIPSRLQEEVERERGTEENEREQEGERSHFSFADPEPKKSFVVRFIIVSYSSRREHPYEAKRATTTRARTSSF